MKKDYGYIKIIQDNIIIKLIQIIIKKLIPKKDIKVISDLVDGKLIKHFTFLKNFYIFAYTY